MHTRVLIGLAGALALAVPGTNARAAELIPAPDVPLTASGPVEANKAGKKNYIIITDRDSVPTWFKNNYPNLNFNPRDTRAKDYGEEVLAENRALLADYGVDSEDIVSNLSHAGAMATARLTAAQADALRADPRVRAVLEDELVTIQTNESPDYLGLTKVFSPWRVGVLGEDVVVGVLDTGIHPEHPSFADEMVPVRTGPFGNLFRRRGRTEPYPAAPESWNGDGTCQFGNDAYNPDDAPFECNNKLLGARYYVDGFLGFSSIVDDEFLSARDASDHGSHVAGTAAGNFGVEAELGGEPEGEISGIAPRARLSVYKVCWKAPGAPSFSCANSDTIAAIDQAIADGVDVINFSVGGPSTTFGASDLAWLSAADAGIWVATSNGNSGPGANTVGTPAGAPWMTSVGAMQDSGVFASAVVVNSPASIAGSYEGLEGAGDVSFENTGSIIEEIVPADPLEACGPVANDLTGKIALVIRGACSFTDKYNSVAAAGAAAIVVYNDGTSPDRIDPITMTAPGTTIPGIMIDFFAGSDIRMAAEGGEIVEGAVGPEFRIPLEGRIAGFSSRGPNGAAPDIIKPDIAAPGVTILAAGSPFTADGPDDGNLFLNLSGTSMASPHVAGAFALLHQVHPDWTPAMARSALMTTAASGLLETDGSGPADPFDVGSGLLNPREMFRPGLVYDAGIFDYLAFSCENNTPFVDQASCDFLESEGFPTEGSALNYPSIGVSKLIGTKTITRTVTSVAKVRRTFRVSVNAPPGVEVDVSPKKLKLSPGESATYSVTLTTTEDAVADQWTFGSLTWRSGFITATSPIAVRPSAIAFPEEIVVSGTSGEASFDVEFGYTGEYTARVHGLTPAAGISFNVADDPNNSYQFPFGPGTVTYFFEFLPNTALARFQTRDVFTDGNDDLDLYVWECDPTGLCSQVGSSANATSDETVDVAFPIDATQGFYVVEVHAFDTDGPDVNATLLLWDFGIDDDRNNVVLEAPTEATFGTTAPVTVSWPGPAGLADFSLYLGAVSHSTPEGIVGLTLIDLTTVD